VVNWALAGMPIEECTQLYNIPIHAVFHHILTADVEISSRDLGIFGESQGSGGLALYLVDGGPGVGRLTHSSCAEPLLRNTRRRFTCGSPDLHGPYTPTERPHISISLPWPPGCVCAYGVTRLMSPGLYVNRLWLALRFIFVSWKRGHWAAHGKNIQRLPLLSACLGFFFGNVSRCLGV